MDCPNCGKDNSGDSPLCSSCGWVLCWEPAPKDDKRDGRRVVSGIALFAAIATFCLGVGIFLPSLPLDYPGKGSEFDFIGLGLFLLYFLSLSLFFLLCPIASVLAIVALFIEHKICRRLLPLVLVLAGIGLVVASGSF